MSTPERVPACVHFLRGKCANSSCRYAHVQVNASAPVCGDFAILGFCAKGEACSDRHVFECPDHANKGLCRRTKCRLPHVDRAGQIRKHLGTKSTGLTVDPADDENNDIVSDEETSSDQEDVDSDGMEEIMDWPDDAGSHAISEQQDFVGF